MKWIKNIPSKEEIKKISKEYGVNIIKTSQFEQKVSETNSVAYENDEESFDFSGLQSTNVSYSGLLNPICKYAFSKIIESGKDPLFFTSKSFSRHPGTCEISTDVDKTDTAFNDACAIYEDKIVSISEEYGTVTVSCYSKNKKDTKLFINALNDKMKKDNQYRGKCLFFSDESVVFRDTPAIDWDDVILNSKSKNEIKINTIDFLLNTKLSNLGISRRGLILHGPPGTGKTMMVKSIFNKMANQGITRVYATADTFTYPGIVTNLFDFLKFTGKTILAFEDMDLISPERSDNSGRKVLGALLNNLDGIRKIDDPLVVIGTTNDISMLDSALSNRPCRFDRKIEVPLPEKDEIKEFYKIMIGSDVNDEIISLSSGFSGAHIKEVINTASLLSMETNIDKKECLKDACLIIKDNFFPMTKEASKIMYKNQNQKMSKESQIQMITPFITNPISDNYSIIPLMRFLKKPSEYSNKEATSLWKIWKGHDGKITNNKIAINLKDHMRDVEILLSSSIIKNEGEEEYSLTEKGQKLLRSIILTSEVNTFEKNTKEPEEIDMSIVERRIHGSKNKKSKLSSKNDNKNKKINKDWYFNAIKNI